MHKRAFEALQVIGIIVGALAAVEAATWLLSSLAIWFMSLTNETSLPVTPAINKLAVTTAITGTVLFVAWLVWSQLPTATFIVMLIACPIWFFWSREHIFPGTPVSSFTAQVLYCLGFAVWGFVVFCASFCFVLLLDDDSPDDEQAEDDSLVCCS